MAPLPFAPTLGDEFCCGRDPCPGLRGLGTDRVKAGARRVGEGEVRVGCDCLIQGLGSTRPGREQEVDALPIALGREVGGGRERQAAAVEAGLSMQVTA